MNLSKLKSKYVSLDSKVEFYLPSMTSMHVEIVEVLLTSARLEISRRMSAQFGGATLTRAVGFYENKALNRTQTEAVEIIYSYASRLTDMDIKMLIETAEKYRDLLEQESIMVVINGSAVFI